MTTPPTRVREQYAVKALMHFICEDADLDDLARLYATYLAEAPVIVDDEFGHSNTFHPAAPHPPTPTDSTLILIPTYNGHLFPDEIDAGRKDEYGTPETPVLVYRDVGLRLLLGATDPSNSDKPDLLVERQPNGWLIVPHPEGSDPSGYLYLHDDGRSFIVPENGLGPIPPFQILPPGASVPGFHHP